MSRRITLLVLVALGGGLLAAAAAARDVGTVRGVVVGPDGRTVPGARVSMSFADVVSVTGRLTTTDADGSFRLEGVTRGRVVKVYAAAPGFGLGISDRVVLRKSDEEDASTIVRLPPAAAIRGRVIGKDGKPLRDAEAIASGVHRGLALRPPTVRTDEEGRYAFESLAAGTWNLAIRAEGHAPAGRKGRAVREGETLADVDFSLGEGRVLAGTVVDSEGRPVAFEPIHVSSRGFPVAGVAKASARTDAAGKFRVVHLADLPCSLSMESPKVDTYRQDVHPDESPLTLRVEVLGHLEGRAVRKDGKGFTGAFTVYVMPTGASTPYPTWIAPSPYRKITGSADGTFRIRGFRPGVYDVIVLAGGPRVSNRVNRIRVLAGKAAAIETPLVVEGCGWLGGRVVDARGGPIRGASVTLLTPDGKRAEGWCTAVESHNGIYQLWGVRAGKYLLRATASGGRETTLEVEVVAGKRIKTDVSLLP